jgi:hypothetical protein
LYFGRRGDAQHNKAFYPRETVVIGFFYRNAASVLIYCFNDAWFIGLLTPALLWWSSAMALELERDGILSAVIAGLPKVAKLISTIPEEQRPQALEAAEQSYLQTARELGYEGEDAQHWVSAIMLRLRLERASECAAMAQADWQ